MGERAKVFLFLTLYLYHNCPMYRDTVAYQIGVYGIYFVIQFTLSENKLG
jgi:hypothetical protein